MTSPIAVEGMEAKERVIIDEGTEVTSPIDKERIEAKVAVIVEEGTEVTYLGGKNGDKSRSDRWGRN